MPLDTLLYIAASLALPTHSHSPSPGLARLALGPLPARLILFSINRYRIGLHWICIG